MNVPRVKKEAELIEEFYRDLLDEENDDPEYRPIKGFLLYSEDWLTGVRHYTDFQRGWYIQLLVEAWQRSRLSGMQGTLPNNQRRLMQLAGNKRDDNTRNVRLQPTGNTISTENENEGFLAVYSPEADPEWQEVLENFTAIPGFNSLLHNKKLTKVLMSARRTYEKQSRAGKASSERRWSNDSSKEVNSTGISRSLPNHNQTIASEQPNHAKLKTKNSLGEEPLAEEDPSAFVLTPFPSSSPEQEELRRKELLKHEVVELFDFWRVTMKKTAGTILDANREKKIVARLKHHSKSDIQKAIIGCSMSDFHMGREEGKPKKHNDIYLICQDEKHLEQFIGFYEVNPNGNFPTSGANSDAAKRELEQKWATEDATTSTNYPPPGLAPKDDDDLQPLLP